MFCQNCGTDLGNNGKKFCPNCGVPTSTAETVQDSINISTESNRKRKTSKSAFGVIVCIFLLIATVFFGTYFLGNARERKEKILIGSWEGDDFSITFTADGHMQIGRSGISVGGDMFTYELLDENTLCLYSSDYPVGMEIDCNIMKNYLQLEIDGMTLEFYKN